MTAVNIICQHERALLMTDAVWYDAKGVVTKIAPKARLLPHLPAAIAARGQIDRLVDVLIETISHLASSFDDLIVLAGAAIKPLWTTMTVQGAFGDDDSLGELFFVGWSPAHKAFESYVVVLHNRYEKLSPPVAFFELKKLDPVILTPPPGEDDLRAVGWKEPADAESFDPIEHGIKLMEAQRRFIGPMDNGAGKNGVTGHGVGGFIQITTITSQEITTRVIPHWPQDKVGERIMP